MPYEIVPNHPNCPMSKPYGVAKKADTGKVMGYHVSRADADKQMAALHASEDMHKEES